MPRYDSYGERARRTSCPVWMAAIFCAILAATVFIAGLVILITYLIYQPKSPYLNLDNAQLIRLDYDQSGTLNTELQITVSARNGNKNSRATFTAFNLLLVFADVNIAQLQVPGTFIVPKNSSLPLPFDAKSDPIPLDSRGMSAMDAALKNLQVPFVLSGGARAQWRLGSLYTFGHRVPLQCQMMFFLPPNGTLASAQCNGKK